MACLATPVRMTGRAAEDARQAAALRGYIDAARGLGCPLVRVLDAEPRKGHSLAATGVVLGDWLAPLGDYAAERGVTLVVENAITFRTARDLWGVLDRIQHPAVACCWDVLSAARAGESPYTAAAVLNSRIRHVRCATPNSAGGGRVHGRRAGWERGTCPCGRSSPGSAGSDTTGT